MITPERREYMRKWRAENKEKRAAYQRQWKFGVSPEQHDAMLEQQSFKCAVCQTDEPTCVDHCHTSGAVRGLLCRPCNLGLGHFKDNATTIANAIAYLKRN
jgi:hypothetical protein